MAKSLFEQKRALFHQTKPPADFLTMFWDGPRWELMIRVASRASKQLKQAPSEWPEVILSWVTIGLLRDLFQQTKPPADILSNFLDGLRWELMTRIAPWALKQPKQTPQSDQNSNLGQSKNIFRNPAGGLVWWNRTFKSPNVDSAKFHLWSLWGVCLGCFK